MRDDSGGSFEQVMRLTHDSAAARRYAVADRYDFRQTEKFSQDQQKFLERVFDAFAEQCVTRLATLLQTRVVVQRHSIKQQAYQKYLNSLPDPTALVVFKVDPESRAILTLEYDLSFGLLDKLMGGKGVPLEEVRYFTDLERAILQKPVERLLAAYTEAWREVQELRIVFQSLEFNPLAVHVAPPSETMVVVKFEVDIAQTKGTIEICVPFRHLKPIVPKASFDEFLISRQAPQGAPGVPNIFAKGIEGAKVPVSVELGRAEVLFQDLLGLEVGDTIKLDSAVGDLLRIRVNEKTKFLGRPGTTRDGRLVAQLTRVLSEGDEEFEE